MIPLEWHVLLSTQNDTNNCCFKLPIVQLVLFLLQDWQMAKQIWLHSIPIRLQNNLKYPELCCVSFHSLST